MAARITPPSSRPSSTASASAGTPLEFVLDQPGTVLCAGTIKVWGGQTIRAVPGTLLKKAGSATSNGAPLLQNKHPVAYGAGSQVDQGIILRDLTIDGNRRGGSAGAGGAYPFVNASGYVVPTLLLSGVNQFHIENVHILDSPSYGLQLSNAINGTIVNFSKYLWPSDTETAGAGDAIVQCQGGTSNVHMYHLFGSAGDDPIAFNANDGNDIPDATITFAPGTVAQGPITHCSVNDSYFLPNPNGTYGQPGRLLSSNPSSYIDDITYNNVTGWCRYASFNMDNFGVALGSGSLRQHPVHQLHILPGRRQPLAQDRPRDGRHRHDRRPDPDPALGRLGDVADRLHGNSTIGSL